MKKIAIKLTIIALIIGFGTYWLTRENLDDVKRTKAEKVKPRLETNGVAQPKRSTRQHQKTVPLPPTPPIKPRLRTSSPRHDARDKHVKKSSPHNAVIKSARKSNDKTATTPKRSDLNVKRFVKELEIHARSMDTSAIDGAVGNIINSELLNSADIAVALSKSENAKCAGMGLDLMTEICVKRPDLLQPNKFLVAFARRGTREIPRISRIIDETDDDFTREWACELFTEIFFHNTPKTNNRHKKLAELKKQEKKIYAFASDVVSNTKNLAKMVNNKTHPGDIIREQWGTERRYPLKMLAILRSFELLTTPTLESVAARIAKIVDSNDMRYDILGRVNGKIINRPPIPLAVKLRVLSSAVFKDKYDNTDKWISRKRNGFTKKELEFAVESRDSRKMESMYRALRVIIGNVLRAKLEIGLGNQEITLLRHFDQATLDGKPFRWNDKALTLINETDSDVKLTIRPDAAKTEGKNVAFTLLKDHKLVWFTPKGEFVIESTPDSKIAVAKTDIPLTQKDFTLVISKK